MTQSEEYQNVMASFGQLIVDFEVLKPFYPLQLSHLWNYPYVHDFGIKWPGSICG